MQTRLRNICEQFSEEESSIDIVFFNTGYTLL